MTSPPEVLMNRTKNVVCAIAIGVASLWAAGLAVADTPQTSGTSSDKSNEKSAGSTDMSKSMSMMEKKSAEATVVRVDTAKRHLVLQGDNGQEFTVNVPEKIKRLNEIKPGDKIKVDYFESLALSLEPPGAGGTSGTKSKTMTERSAGKLPGGTVAHQETGMVEIVKIDKADNQITVKRPNGDMDVIDVKDPQLQSHLDQLKEGDKVKASYTEAAVVNIERPNQNQQGMNEKNEKSNQQGMNEKQNEHGMNEQQPSQQPNRSM
jgi:hypothetical protein